MLQIDRCKRRACTSHANSWRGVLPLRGGGVLTLRRPTYLARRQHRKRQAELPVAREAFVTNQLGDSLSIVDIAAGKAVAEIKIGGKPAGIALSPDGSRAYLAAPEGKEVVVVDTAARAVVARWAAGQGPLGIAVNPKSGLVYVADWYEHVLMQVDPATGAITGKVQVGRVALGRGGYARWRRDPDRRSR